MIFKIIKNIISPKKCYSCKKEWHFLCKKCLDEIWYFQSICPVCKKKSDNFEVHENCKNKNIFYDKIIILTHYKNKIIKKLIKDAKFYHLKDILEDLSVYLWEKLLENIKLHSLKEKQNLLLISTPMFFLKKIMRWYNQSEILVKNISKNFLINYDLKLIKKTKLTKSQSHLKRIERIKNLKNAFILNEKKLKKYKNKTFIIVDDVVSTWSTINEIAKLLKSNWVKKVYAICIASD